MISKAQENTLSRGAVMPQRLRMSALEKCMLRCAVVDANDRVLDANITNGLMAEYLRRNEICEVCGISGSMENVKRARELLRGCDIVYAGTGDIPWPDCTFNLALMQLERAERGDTERWLNELERVLKEGGQLILGCASALSKAITSASDDYESYQPCACELSELLAELGFVDIARRRAGLMNDVVIAWKRKPDAESTIDQ